MKPEMMSQTYFIFLFFCFSSLCFCVDQCRAMAQNKILNSSSSFHVGVVLDLDSPIGSVGWSCISMARSDFYATHSNYKTRLVLHLIRNSNRDVVDAAFSALDLLKNVTVQAIIGPQTSAEADFVIELGDKAQVPIISFSATSPSLSLRSPYFLQAAQTDSSQVKPIIAIIQAFKWREVVLIYEDTDYGNGVIPYLIDSLQEIETRVPYRSVISLSATDDQILEELYKLMTMQTRVFVVHMSNSIGSRLFLKAKEAGMMKEEYAWIITDGLMNLLDSLDASVIASMQGVLGVKPFIPRSKELDNFTMRWKRNFRQELNIYGLWAYDTISALAMAAERVGVMNSHYKNSRTNNLTDHGVATLETSQNGPKLLEAILKTRFKGLSGDFYLTNGELQSSIFQILNVIGKGEREVAFWTPTHGISRESDFTGEKMYRTSMTEFRSIIWPGESMSVPKGWTIPTSGKKLKIGVPVTHFYREFAKVERDPYTNRTMIGGYCIDVFNSVIEALPYAVPHEFIPFEQANGSTAGNYNDLVYQVYLQNYDAVVGDVMITANRSLYVDFTLPFAEGGVSMVVPIEYKERKNTWIFLKPLTKELWLTTGAFFVLTGFVIWVLEHRINDAFRGPPAQHIGMIFWFPLSTFVFAHRERVVSNLTRLVVIIWVFVVLILNSSYTASLSSMLTVQRLQPAVTDIQELIKNGDYVGYQEGSFVADVLKRLNFDASKLKSYNSPEDFDEALTKGSQNGGITAIFDSMLYIKLFLAKYCDKYTVIGPIHKTSGVGFVFPKGSPLVADVSRAILNITEGNKIADIDRKLFGLPPTCSEPGKNFISNSLKLNSFRGLFIVTGTISGFALLVSLAIFFYKHKHVLTTTGSENRLWLRLRTMLKQFDQKDLSSYRFKRTEVDKGQAMEVRDVEATPDISSYTDRNCSSLEGVLSMELGDPISSFSATEEMVEVSLSD